jgi:hypothetical protein
MSFSPDDIQTARQISLTLLLLLVIAFGTIMVKTQDTALAAFNYTLTQFDISSAPGHVRSNGHRAGLTGLGNDDCFTLMMFRIQNLMRDTATL